MPLEEHDGYKTGEDFATDVRESLKGADIPLNEETALSFYLYLPKKRLAESSSQEIQKLGLEAELEESADETSWFASDHTSSEERGP